MPAHPSASSCATRTGWPTFRRTSSGRKATCTTRTTCAVPSPVFGPPSTSARTRPTRSSSLRPSSPPARPPASDSSSPEFTSTTEPAQQVMYRLLFRLWLRHYQGKLAVAKAIERSATNPVLLIPSNFMQNDDVFLDDIAAGEFCQPLAGVNRWTSVMLRRSRRCVCSTTSSVPAHTVSSVPRASAASSAQRSGGASSAARCATPAATRAPGRRRSRATSRVGSSSTGRPPSGALSTPR